MTDWVAIDITGIPRSEMSHASIGIPARGIHGESLDLPNVLTVGAGMHYADPVSAVAASVAGNIILIHPGTYTGQIVPKDGVDIVGVDRDKCIIQVATDVPAFYVTTAVRGASFRVSNLTIQNVSLVGAVEAAAVDFSATGGITGTQVFDGLKLLSSTSDAVHFHGDGDIAAGGSVTFRNCYIRGAICAGIYGTTGGTPLFDHCTLTTYTTQAFGLGVSLSGAMGGTFEHCTITTESTTDADATGVQAASAGTVTLDHCVVSASNSTNGTTIYGINLSAAGTLLCCNSYVAATNSFVGATGAYGVRVGAGTATVSNCTIKVTSATATANALKQTAGTLNVYGCEIIGGTVSGTITYLGQTAGETVLMTGDIETNVIGKGYILKSPDGTRYRIKVANGGALSTEAA